VGNNALQGPYFLLLPCGADHGGKSDKCELAGKIHLFLTKQ
jgi:hypothetical protein